VTVVLPKGITVSKSKKELVEKGNLFIPLIFSLGANLEDIPLDLYFNEPTKISNSLRVIHNYFKVDGVVFCGDDTCLLEDLGGNDSPHKKPLCVAASKETFESVESRIEKIGRGGKSKVAIEVAKRLNILMPDTIAVGVMPGPVKLACQLIGCSPEEVFDNQELLALTIKATLTFIHALGETGIDLLFIRENKLQFTDTKSPKGLNRCYSPLLNLASHYSLKAFLMPNELSNKNVSQLKETVDRLIFPASTDTEKLKAIRHQSFSIPTTLLEKAPKDIELYLSQSGILDALKSSRLFLVTTDQDIPMTINKRLMIRGIQTIRDFMSQEF
jgi:hypothetical protein